jgi:hypothetical protein
MIGDDEFTRYYAPLLDDMYDVVDRITINARYHFACTPGGFRCWWFDRFGTFDNLNDTFLMRLAGRYGRRVQGWANKHKIPVVDCRKGVRKDQLIKEYLPADPNFVGVFAIFTTRRPSPVWRVLRSDKSPAGFHLEYKNPRPWVKHYHFHIMDKTWGHVIVSMSGQAAQTCAGQGEGNVARDLDGPDAGCGRRSVRGVRRDVWCEVPRRGGVPEEGSRSAADVLRLPG